MVWLELQLVVPRTGLESVSQALFELGASGLQEDFLPGEAPPVRQPWDRGPDPALPPRALIRTWWEPSRARQIQPDLDRLLVDGSILDAIQWVPVPEEDWANAWRAGFKRVEISPRLTLAPPWEATEGDLVIEPGMAFGTGEHTSTRACLEAIDRLARPGETLLDIGCGTGVLALAGAHLGMVARGIDTDLDAVEASRENAERNGLQGVFDSTPLQRIEGRFQLVVANLYAEVLVELAPHIDDKVDHHLVLAGILADRQEMVRDSLRSLKLLEVHSDGDWVCLEYRR